MLRFTGCLPACRYQFQRRWWPLCSPCSPQVNMFNLMSNCCSWVAKIQEPLRKVTILVVGLDKAGKTSSIRGMLRVPPGVDAGPTHGCIKNELRVENYLVTLLDVGGSAESRGAWRELYGEAHGVIFVVDSSDRQRMKEARDVLADLLKQPRVAGKPILVLANKQDKMNALLGSELIEILSLEKLVNQSRSLCHIEPCSALMDLRRWSDRKTLRGLRWLLRAVCLDYPDLCARVAQDSKRPLEPREREKKGRPEKVQRISKLERMRSSKSDLRQVHRSRDKEKRNSGEGKLQPIRNMLQKENTLKKRLRSKKMKKKPVKVKEGVKDVEEAPEEEEEGEANEGEQESSGSRDKASSALIPPKKSKLKSKTKVKEDMLDAPGSLESNETPTKAKGERKKKKVVKVKRKNKINTEGMPVAYSQPVDLSETFDLYRKAIQALKERQDQAQGQ
ncbi:ADP-ribosylation factor-like protein 13A isoform X1 [Poecilia latipinna]|uniref:ADP-ribosylation factor-like protein 13A isoform X1 n=1 Tax=Poecilia latipinna TaxID=48699 RepID=UPI00072EEE69|nr:PREDICTED: ADP-ribosylation factor-like protein 13A isoform X1 [Poecilia latipinna]XP_016535999.1 PREDICTED: ADP-ribosylation factor-like protein 13A isoform X1 [Poecilia formosa]